MWNLVAHNALTSLFLSLAVFLSLLVSLSLSLSLSLPRTSGSDPAPEPR